MKKYIILFFLTFGAVGTVLTDSGEILVLELTGDDYDDLSNFATPPAPVPAWQAWVQKTGADFYNQYLQIKDYTCKKWVALLVWIKKCG